MNKLELANHNIALLADYIAKKEEKEGKNYEAVYNSLIDAYLVRDEEDEVAEPEQPVLLLAMSNTCGNCYFYQKKNEVYGGELIKAFTCTINSKFKSPKEIACRMWAEEGKYDG